MKFQVTMKNPDVLHDAIKEAVQEQLDTTLPEDEADALLEMRTEKIQNVCKKWFQYGEYITVEVDIDANTCTVVPK